MTTQITITLPIAPGAKTCEGCDRLRWTGTGWDCDPLHDVTPKDHGHCVYPARLPECIAGERIVMREWWEVRHTTTPELTVSVGTYSVWCSSLKVARGVAHSMRMQSYVVSVSIVHVTRYRRAI